MVFYFIKKLLVADGKYFIKHLFSQNDFRNYIVFMTFLFHAVHTYYDTRYTKYLN